MQIREDIFTVKTYECQADGSMKLHVLMQHLQEAAAVHAEQLGFGYDRLNQINSCWVLSNLRIEIDRLPRWNEKVTVTTWPSGHNRVAATREFVGRDPDGCELFKAGSEWMVLDREKNRPKNLLRLGLPLPESGQKTIAGKLTRLEPRSSYSQVEHVRVPYSSIDLNGHANNTEYVRWAMDALRRTFQFKGSIHFAQATYLAEVFEGDQIDLLLSCPPPRLLPGRCKAGESADAEAGDKAEHFYILGKRPSRQDNVYLMELGC